ncbi:D-alanyl-D-alanine carboxypeptidase [Nisaea acidiphila]|uniref:D-alanyl-D-alanine carboxypeptidase n=1 Tax=Nisaea acidiphila TaxID=1862145 RepID=A0A9J7APL2_9PROT|nr:D-alanyl-D-alanine carboxypeptidase family protein [Nisaea acidiphila]UUX49151.1 D-alanyl-D-alanine carboxypeptidase [Nisaea acidiphila]
MLALSFSVWLAATATAEARYASFVMDAETLDVLYAKNADTRNYPASLTKIMTLYMLFDALERGKVTLSTRMKVSKRAAGQPETNIDLRVGQTLSVRDAILALVTRSANDAATVVAEHLAKSEVHFAIAMTKKAHNLGMTRTTFRNASGLPNRRQKSTARDMAKLGLRIQRDFPQYYHYFKTKKFTFNGRTYKNHNNLLGRYSGTDGIKTGYTRASGFNLVSSVQKDGHHVIAVVFGGRTAKSRDKHMVSLLNRGFRKAIRIARNRAPAPIPVARPVPGTAPTVQLAAAQSAITDDVLQGSAGGGDLTEGDWGIQVGAYSSRGPAEQMIRTARTHLKAALAASTDSVEQITRDHGTVFRSRIIGLSEAGARNACALLARKHVPCVPVPGDTGEEVATIPAGG